VDCLYESRGLIRVLILTVRNVLSLATSRRSHVGI